MPVPVATSGKNIWVAAGDGDLERVQELVGRKLEEGIAPNAPDQNTYTPMHAAASYGHLHVLEYLISQGGDVNVLDEDGDSPLYTVEDVQTAQYLVEKGATWDMRNAEGLTPAGALEEDFPAVSEYLRSLDRPAATSDDAPNTSSALDPAQSIPMPSEYIQDLTARNMTDGLMQRVEDIMRRAEAEGRDPDEELRAALGDVFQQGMQTGRNWGAEGREQQGQNGDVDGEEAKRRRHDEL
ncbi:ankyrin [Calocera cornea HHB12733]|uniref:Ankyrin n=1 Tax=Calocera cornea HHB12733 TaxID=1353952 RepID=A0A165FLY0_9BASI|nr:ankyrin [Calocera cornea HHB12733]